MGRIALIVWRNGPQPTNIVGVLCEDKIVTRAILSDFRYPYLDVEPRTQNLSNFLIILAKLPALFSVIRG